MLSPTGTSSMDAKRPTLGMFPSIVGWLISSRSSIHPLAHDLLCKSYSVGVPLALGRNQGLRARGRMRKPQLRFAAQAERRAPTSLRSGCVYVRIHLGARRPTTHTPRHSSGLLRTERKTTAQKTGLDFILILALYPTGCRASLQGS